ncbi:translation initiation factor IF-2 [Helicobacter cappadocius]|uniref:Translation initiation factor IF-2 n=1 Tax=Helicobacter cappadocius TaxID=3063998 RepID=A0AA90PTI1_9HELI|nr:MULTISPECIES: translation initiation factor IF-2 [unclassified Helicobacter]MDO7253306.1 translation initiation factor IF-2 [Helicobacter sp. faydin-H75]MDP2539264.1 translation initiation factor IF-2 [Helicobacter sp. faydin-H76]
MAKVRLTEIANEAGRAPKEVLEKAKEMGLNVKAASSALSEEEAAKLYEYITTGVNNYIPTSSKTSKTTKKTQETDQIQPKKPTKKENKSLKEAPKKDEQETKKDVVIQDKEEAIIKESIEENTEVPKIESVSAEASVARRTGIRIVKKGNFDEIAPKATSKKHQYAPSAQEMLEEMQSEQDKTTKKPKKSAKPKAQQKHKEQKIDLLSERALGNVDEYDDEQNEIMLFDLHEQDIRDEEEENQVKQAITDRIKVHKKNPWMSEGSIKRSIKRRKPPKQDTTLKVAQSVISIPEEIRVYEFADISGRSLAEVVKVLFNLGMMVTKNDFLDRDAIEILADEFQIEISIQNTVEELDFTQTQDENVQNLTERPPVVTIMGHVDHGKTSLLDKIRNARVASAEAGGITQHIGAYMVEKNGKMISFIDTPGHEAFTEMRSRGAQVTDIVIVVIAADDGVKQQTIEAFKHAKEAGVQIIVAMNKMDKENANPDKLKAECAEIGFNPIDWGGEYEFIPVSAKTGDGIEELLETILIQAEVMELKADSSVSAKAVVLEGSVEKGRGSVATIIVQNGTLRLGDSIVAGVAFGRVRALIDDRGRNIKELHPSGVAVVTGLSEVPSAGSILISVQSDSIAKEYAQKRATYLRQKELSKSTKVSFDELSEMVAKGQLKSIPIIIKADTQGSLEAIKSSLEKLNNDEVEVNVISMGVGGITESDISLAAASSNSIILGFNVRPTGTVKIKAKEMGVEIKTYSIIYALIDDMKALVSGLMSPIIEEENTGQAEVRDTFVISKVGTIAGCMVTDGVIQRGINIRLIRDGVVIHTGTIASLKRFKDDAKEVSKGYECGIMLEKYNDIRVGDVFETYKEIQKNQII